MFFTHLKKLIIPIVVVIVGIKYRNELAALYKNTWHNIETNEKNYDSSFFTQNRLGKYNGQIENKLYVAVLGTIFDVSIGAKYYAKGSSYHYFVGKDGSRALITGNFNDESNDKDHVLDLSCSDLFTIIQWKNTFNDKYEMVGLLIGRYFDKHGKETAYTKELNNRLEQCIHEKEAARKHDFKYPPCNIAWSEEEGTKVWCTKTSGGISRNWAGVPRQLYSPGTEKPQCVCVNLDDNTSKNQFKKYEKCPEHSNTCFIKVD